MSITRTTPLLFDSSCWVAASGSPSGGSSFLLTLVAQGYLKALISQPILIESERNVREQLRPEALPRFYQLVATTPMSLVALPPKTNRRRYVQIVGEKDEHVLAAAVDGQAEYLLTLDKPLEQRVNQAKLGIRALSPGEFITTVLINHEDYPAMR